jgi:hypothetical protein
MKVGVVFPGSCQAGELFFKSNAIPGANIYTCSASDLWILLAGLPTQGSNGVVLTSNGVSASWVDLDGDVSGPVSAATVTKLQRRPVATTAPVTGQALIWSGSYWQPQTLAGTAGTITFESNGTAVGVRGVENLVPGNGVMHVVTDTGSKLNIQTMIDTAVVETKAASQAGGSLLCLGNSVAAPAFLCGLTPQLSAYRVGMVLHWIPDFDAMAGGSTLNIDGLGAKAVKLSDGVNNPLPADVIAGKLFEIWYDGTVFRVLNTAGPLANSSTRPDCSVALRGRLWQIFADSAIADEVAVCTKDATDTYAWHVIN